MRSPITGKKEKFYSPFFFALKKTFSIAALLTMVTQCCIGNVALLNIV
jgi:hypothetical protein